MTTRLLGLRRHGSLSCLWTCIIEAAFVSLRPSCEACIMAFGILAMAACSYSSSPARKKAEAYFCRQTKSLQMCFGPTPQMILEHTQPSAETSHGLTLD